MVLELSTACIYEFVLEFLWLGVGATPRLRLGRVWWGPTRMRSRQSRLVRWIEVEYLVEEDGVLSSFLWCFLSLVISFWRGAAGGVGICGILGWVYFFWNALLIAGVACVGMPIDLPCWLHFYEELVCARVWYMYRQLGFGNNRRWVRRGGCVWIREASLEYRDIQESVTYVWESL